MELHSPTLIHWKAILVGVVMLGAGLFNLSDMRGIIRWVECPAVIDRVDIEGPLGSRKNAWEMKVNYHWEWNGRIYKGNRFSMDDRPSEDRVEIETEAAKWPAGGTVRCWVDPAHPSQAVLDRWKGAETGFALSLIGLCLLAWRLWWPRWAARPWRWILGDRPPFPREGWGWALAFLLFGGIFAGLGIQEALNYRRSAGWLATPCEILESRLVFEGHEFKPEIRYQWEAGGQLHESRRVNWSTFQGGVLDVEQTVAAHPSEQPETCWVNPEIPGEAVLETGFKFRGSGFWIGGFLMCGLTGGAFLTSWRRWRKVCRGWAVEGAAQKQDDGQNADDEQEEEDNNDNEQDNYTREGDYSFDESRYGRAENDPRHVKPPFVSPPSPSRTCPTGRQANSKSRAGLLMKMLTSSLRALFVVGIPGALGTWALWPTVRREWHYGVEGTPSQWLLLVPGMLLLAAVFVLLKAIRDLLRSLVSAGRAKRKR